MLVTSVPAMVEGLDLEEFVGVGEKIADPKGSVITIEDGHVEVKQQQVNLFNFHIVFEELSNLVTILESIYDVEVRLLQVVDDD